MKTILKIMAIYLVIYFAFGYTLDLYHSSSDTKHDAQESNVQMVEKTSYIEYKPEPVRDAYVTEYSEQSVVTETEPTELRVPGKDYSYAHGYYYQFLNATEQKVYDC